MSALGDGHPHSSEIMKASGHWRKTQGKAKFIEGRM